MFLLQEPEETAATDQIMDSTDLSLLGLVGTRGPGPTACLYGNHTVQIKWTQL